MKTWVPRYEQIAALSPDEKRCFYQRGRRVIDTIALFGVGGLGISGVIAVVFLHVVPIWITAIVGSTLLITAFYLLVLNEIALSEGTKRILREKWHDPKALSALINLADTQRGKGIYPFRDWGMDNLRLVLPLLQDEQYTMLSAKDRRRFYALITVEATPDFLLAAIETLGCFADVEALPTVRKVAEAAAFTPQQRAARQRAQECVAFLEARVQEKTLEQSLLRGSAANADASHILLRAAAGQETLEAERHELLRANVQQ